MAHRLSRRSFVQLPAAGLATLLPPAWRAQSAAGRRRSADWFPRQDPALAQEVVGASHGNLAKVRELVERQPALARSAIDWGFGDWETALGAAAHTGRREIAELLLANGAQPTLFSAAMLGHLDVVRAFVASRPGHSRHPRPARHHAARPRQHRRRRCGGRRQLPRGRRRRRRSDRRRRRWHPPIAMPWSAATASAPGRATTSTSTSTAISWASNRPEAIRRGLGHLGDLVFFPAGVPTVKIAFAREAGKVVRLSVADPQVLVTATRI